MYLKRHAACIALLLLVQGVSTAAETDFSGTWTIDYRSALQRRQKVECGGGSITLKQEGNRIRGSHGFASLGCGRLDEGEEGSIKGIVVGSTAVMTIASVRDETILLVKATRQGNTLNWAVIDDVQQGSGENLLPGNSKFVRAPRLPAQQ